MNDTPKLGEIISDANVERDAVHIAIAPVVAFEHLEPGEHVGFIGESRMTVGIKSEKLIGIVDPFLNCVLAPGCHFWLFLYPNTVTSLRHHWTHPSFEEKAVVASSLKDEAERWLRDFSSEHGISYADIVQAARDHIRNGEYFVQLGSESARDAMYDAATRERFWSNFEIVTGTKVSDDDREGYVFSCSC